ncbi:cupin domain-containing protein [Aliamphritea ceti]|uniref:cupin domain-containing protein n=1 Tax=Aliamphritea ceti TaxID=1524258 RepID=UPI0021C313F7|nr:cupin domain-containing protein [Aliamphritea ceti]
MSENMIEVHNISAEEQAACQCWDLWESGDVSEFAYDYDQDVQFIVQQGEAVIHTQFGDSVAIAPGNRVIIRAGVSGRWDIAAPIVNRYAYL